MTYRKLGQEEKVTSPLYTEVQTGVGARES